MGESLHWHVVWASSVQEATSSSAHTNQSHLCSRHSIRAQRSTHFARHSRFHLSFPGAPLPVSCAPPPLSRDLMSAPDEHT